VFSPNFLGEALSFPFYTVGHGLCLLGLIALMGQIQKQTPLPVSKIRLLSQMLRSLWGAQGVPNSAQKPLP
jgi:hypothetical protein